MTTKMRASAKPTVVVFSDHLLYPSETFIRAQADALSDYQPVYAGSRRVPGLKLPTDLTYTIIRGGSMDLLHEVAFKLFGHAPCLSEPLRALNPLLLHAHHGSNGWRALPLARSLGVPFIVTFHGSDATATDLRHEKTHFGHRRYLAHKKDLQDGATLFLAVSRFIQRKLLDQGFPEEKVVVHYTGVDTRMFRPAGTAREPIILFVGRLVERKGAEFLIQATAQVQNEFPTTELVVIGDGPLRTDLERQAKHLLRRYRFLGTRSHEEVCGWMNRASVFCAPSVRMLSGEEEAFGMVYAEAMAMKLPVVAFDSGGVSEVVSHGLTGFLAPERAWRSLAEYIALLLKDDGLRHKFGVAGRERVTRQFDLRERTKILETIYAKVSSRKICEDGAFGFAVASGTAPAD